MADLTPYIFNHIVILSDINRFYLEYMYHCVFCYTYLVFE